MTRRRSISWPTALVLCVALVALSATGIALVLSEAGAETIAAVLGGESALAMGVLAMMRGLLASGGDEDA